MDEAAENRADSPPAAGKPDAPVPTPAVPPTFEQAADVPLVIPLSVPETPKPDPVVRALDSVSSGRRVPRVVEIAAWFEIIGGLTALIGLVVVGVQIQQGVQAEKRAAQDSRLSRQYQAWQTLALTQNLPGSAGRIQALQELNADHVSLRGLDVAWQNAYLEGLDLFPPAADLQGSVFDQADLSHSDLRHANLRGAHLDQARLYGADLRWADLTEASLQGANLTKARLSQATFYRTNLQGAILDSATVDSIMFESCELNDTSFRGASLRSCDLLVANGVDHGRLVWAEDWRGSVLHWPEIEIPDSASTAAMIEHASYWRRTENLPFLRLRDYKIVFNPPILKTIAWPPPRPWKHQTENTTNQYQP